MKIQLLVIIAVLASSLLTISQRANAQEVNQFRWLEPNLEQLCDDSFLADLNSEVDDDAALYFSLNAATTPPISILFPNHHLLVTSAADNNGNPRAPPISSI
ncbi:MAG: hypothetical protein HWE24_15700 [Oceanospirillaceae bacterium]|nr:hypothetical protein [Oceanospirillaceae bacterium]